MATPPHPLSPDVGSLLRLARRDRRAATEALDALDPRARVAAVCEAPLARRAELLELMSRPEEVIPLLPEAELCFIARAIGLEDASWVLAHASSEQLVACLDLDAWQGLAPDPAEVTQWLSSLVEAGEEALLRAASALDPEILVHTLRRRVRVVMKPAGDEAEDWEAPSGSRTLEGVFHLVARRPDDDLASLLAMLDTLFRRDYWLYFRLMQGVIHELDGELVEWALRWRRGRLEDLGFPGWDESMRIYGRLRPEQLAALPDEPIALSGSEWPLPVWQPSLPVPAIGDPDAPLLFRAAAALDAEARSAFFYAFVSLANAVAVADQMPLGDPDTLPGAIHRAARLASRGLEFVAAENGVSADQVVNRLGLRELFRVGANLERERPPRSVDAGEDGEDDGEEGEVPSAGYPGPSP